MVSLRGVVRTVSSFAFSLRLVQTLTALLALAPAAAVAQQVQTLSHHVRPQVADGSAPMVGSMPPDQVLHLSIVLPLRDQAGLTALLGRLYDPSSADFRQFLSVADFTARFGPTASDYAAVAAYAKSYGLAVDTQPANRLIVPVSGTVAQINAALSVRMSVYQHPTENRTFFSPDREPSLRLSVPVAHISGLDDYSLPRHFSVHAQNGQTPMTVNGSGPGGAYLGSDMRAAYYGGSALTGVGQSVGLFEYGGYLLSDVNSSFSGAGQTYTVPINNVLLDGATVAPIAEDGEQVLDIVQAIGMAPGLDQVRVYIGIGSDDANILNSMASENIAKQISCSWGWRPADPTTDDVFFQEMAAQGQSYFTASGDSGAYDALISPFFYPAEDQFVTAVGGTHLTTSGPGGTWVSETVWNSDDAGSGGGISQDGISIPSWQVGLATSANGGSTTLRNIPDVAMEGDFDNYACEEGACDGGWAGTSFAAPRWAGFMALVNQQAVETGNAPKGGLGFLNPTLYQIGRGASASSDLHDVVSGNNQTEGQPLWYSAVAGYDLTTGWGSANGQNLIDDLAGPQVPGFWLATTQGNLSVNPGGSVAANLSVIDAGGFTGSVNLAVTSTLPSGVTASFSPNPTTGKSTLTVTAASSVTATSANITVTGTSGTLTETTTVAVAIHSPNFTLTAAPASLGINQGASGTAAITVTPEYGFSGNVNLTVTGLPSGVTASFSPATTSAASTLTLNVSSTAALGTSTLTITGTSGTITSTTTLSLSIHGPTFVLYAYGPIAVGQGSTASSEVLIEDEYGFTGSVTLTASNLPSGVTASFSPNPSTGYATVTFTASATAATGNATVTITGTSGSITASTTISIGVYAPSFTLIASNNVSLGQGGSGTSYVYVDPQYGFSGGVSLSVSGLPNGVTVAVTPNPASTTATLTFAASSTAVVGQYPIKITGTSGSLTSTTSLTLGVYVPTFTLSTYTAAIALGRGGSSNTSSIYVTPQYGFSGSVNLSVSGLPSGVTASFSPNPTTGTSALTLQASSSAPLGQYTVVVTGTSGSQTASLPLSVGIYTPTFQLANYGGITLGQGNSATGEIYITPEYGFTGSVNLSVSGLPSGVTASFSPNPATTGSNLILTASSTAATGQYTVTVTGTSGTQTATTTLVVGVYKPTFTLSGTNVSVGQGTTSSAYVYVTPQYGFTGAVNLSVSGLPSGVTASFSPNPTTGSSAMTLTASNSAVTGQYVAVITGTSGSTTVTTSITVTVNTPSFTLYSGGYLNAGQGTTAVSYVTVEGQYGFNGNVALSVTGLPAGVTASFSPNPTTYSSTLTLNIAATAALGTSTLTISGTSGSTTSSTTLQLTVYTPSFTLYGTNTLVSLNEGATTTAGFYELGQYGFNGNVTLTATGLPSGITATFSPNPTTYSSTMTLTASGSATPGSYAVTVTGTSGSITSSAPLTVVVNTPSFTLSAPNEVFTYPAATTHTSVAIVPVNGFTGSVSLTASGLPSGVTAAFSPATATTSSVLTFTTSSSAAAGTSTVTLTGTSGGVTESTTVLLTVRPAQAATTTVLALTANGGAATTVAAGTVVTATATVAAGTTPVTAGQVNFCDATAQICDALHQFGTAQLTSAGTATLVFVPAPGVHSVQAVFAGTGANVSSASTAASLSVTASQSTLTTLTTTGSAGNYSGSAIVSGQGAPSPTGTLSILDTTNSNFVLASAAVNGGTPVLTQTSVQTPAAGNGPQSIASGDFNGDGIPDLAVGSSDGSITILLGKGDGTFAASTPFSGASGVQVIVSGDFNHDGKADLAMLLPIVDEIVIYLGNGDGTFTKGSTLSTGSFPMGIAVADFNGDGFQDLAITNEYGNSLTILLGNGDGTFTAAGTVQAGGYPKAIVAADFNGDGVVDLAVTNFYTSGVTILLGNGDGTFTQGTQMATGTYPTSIVAADLNGDGKLDLVIANEYSANATVLLGNGDGTFAASSASPAIGTYPMAVAVADINGDGKPDIVAANYYNSAITLLPGNGDGTFGTATQATTGSSPYALVVGDWNGNGTLDLAVANNGSNNVSILASSFSQKFSLTGAKLAPIGSGQHTVVAQYSGDTVWASSTSAGATLTAGSGPPTVTVTPASKSVPNGQAVTVAINVTGGANNPTPSGTVTLTGGGYTSSATTLRAGAASITIPGGSLAQGTDVLTATYTPDSASSALYTTAVGTASVSSGKATPTLTWPTPAAITYGAALGTVQLNATASVPGTFSYSVTAGTVLSAGAQTLSVTFTPNDTTDYTTATASVTLQVNKATLLLTVNSAARTYGAANPQITGSVTGAVNGDVFTETFSTSATATSPVGTYAIVPSVTGASTANYTVNATNGTLTIVQASVSLTFALSNSNLTFTATVTPQTSGTPTGSVTFYSGSTPIGSGTLSSGGTASYTATSFPSGDVTLSARYSGDANFSGASPLGVPVLTTSLSKATVTMTGAATAADNVTLSVAPGYAGTLQFACSGLPQYATCTFSPASQTFSGSPNSASVALTIGTGGEASLFERRSPFGAQPSIEWAVTLCAPGLLGLLFAARRRRAWRVLALLLVMCGAGIALNGCGGAGGGGGGTTPTNPPTPSGTYTVQLTTTGPSSLTQTSNITLVVQ